MTGAVGPGAIADGRIVIGDAALEAQWLGPGPDEAPTIVLLHEGLGSVSLWRGVPEALARDTGCGVLVYSRQGYGKSSAAQLPRPLTYMHDEALNVLPKLLDAVGFRKGFLVGHSDGASIAAIYAGGVLDDRILGIVLMAPHFFAEESGLEAIRNISATYETTDLANRLARHHGTNTECAFRGWSGAWLDPGFKQWNIEEFLPRIDVPVLLIQGENDAYGTIAQVEAAASAIPGGVEVVLLSGCGHAPQFEAAEQTQARIAAFVRAKRR